VYENKKSIVYATTHIWLLNSPAARHIEYNALTNNCHHDIQQASESCCLRGYDALGFILPYYYVTDEERNVTDHSGVDGLFIQERVEMKCVFLFCYRSGHGDCFLFQAGRNVRRVDSGLARGSGNSLGCFITKKQTN